MGNRTIERSVARALYGDFSKKWRRDKRNAGMHGKPGFKKPSFGQWYAIHQKNEQMMRESTPQDVQEYLGLDPWVEQIPRSLQEIHDEAVPIEERGVVTIPITGGDDE